jgi:hypothetical protein
LQLEFKSKLVGSMTQSRDISGLIEDAGGAIAIHERAESGGIKISRWAVYKWKTSGIPDRHWSMVCEMANATPNEIYDANQRARSQAA